MFKSDDFREILIDLEIESVILPEFTAFSGQN